MNHRFKTPLTVRRITSGRDEDDLFDERRASEPINLKCFVISTQTDGKTDGKPVLYIVKKSIGIPKTADVRISDEVVLLGRRYLVIDANLTPILEGTTGDMRGERQ
jgi:hypothetical protein